MGKPTSKRARFLTEVSVEDFGVLHASHPYGVLPSGNRFFSDTRFASNGLSELFPDDVWSLMLSFLDGKSLGHTVQVCRYLYVAGHQPEIWRDLVLRSFDLIDNMGPSWKDTYRVLAHHPKQSARQKMLHHKPMAVKGVYSDNLYRLHSCRSFALPKQWLEGQDDGRFPRIPVQELTAEVFLESFEGPNKPLLIQGAARNWQAFDKWQNSDYCANATKDLTFRATSGVASQPAQFTWEAYQKYCHEFSNVEEGPLYLFDRAALKPGSQLWNDYMPNLQQSCPWWDPLGEYHHDLFQVLGEGRRPDHTWLIVGPQRSGSVFHIDPNATHAWNAAVVGRKRWIFYPPGVTPPGVLPSPDGDSVALPLSIGEWLFSFWEEHVKRKQTAPLHERPMEVTAQAGDVLFVPHGWWHMVINLDEINIAITHNYVAKSNLSNVLKFLDTKRDQVSGCRDRAESIKPEQLHREFTKELEKRHPGLVKEAEAESDWTCAAWKDTQSVSSALRTSTSVMEKAKSGTDEGGTFSFSFV